MSSSAGTSAVPREVDQIHTRLLQCALAVEESRAYWERVDPDGPRVSAQAAFDLFWFGAKSLPWVKVLLLNMRARFDAFPEALRVLHAWRDMPPDTRTAICHWHLQLSDPLYRAFTGEFLLTRLERPHPEIDRNTVIAWVAERGPSRWTLATRKQFASKLLSAAYAAGLLEGRRDPRRVVCPHPKDSALEYALHLLRGVELRGTLTDNPYLRSVGLWGSGLDLRLRTLPSLSFRRQGDLVEFNWRYASLTDWARATVLARGDR